MIAGARVEVADYKQAPADFVLWKPSKPGEPSWPSPWGEGRPGWHIECSAMIERHLGLPIDIHGGGHDLIFPHHENEIAQGRCANHGEPYAGYWMHNGFLTLDREKMSKSAGGTLRVHDLVKAAPGEALRWALLSAHYRAPLDWTDELVAQSRRSLDRLYGVLQDAHRLAPGASAAAPDAGAADGVAEALENDLNTPEALAQLFVLADALRASVTGGDLAGVARGVGALTAAGRPPGSVAAGSGRLVRGGRRRRPEGAGRGAPRRPRGRAPREGLARRRPHPRGDRGAGCRGAGRGGRRRQLAHEGLETARRRASPLRGDRAAAKLALVTAGRDT